MTTVRVGVYIPGDAQFLDAACVDVLGMMSHEYFAVLGDGIPAHVTAAAPHMTIFYITTPAQMVAGKVPLTSSGTIVPTHDIHHPDVQPGKLDIVVVPGPDPSTVFDKAACEFLKGHADVPTTDILSICTGIYVCGQAGILQGRKASGPRGLQADILKKYPGVTLVGDQYRWVQDGNLWSSGGITNGNDLVAAYARSCRHIPTPVAEIACSMADVGDRGQTYAQGQAIFTVGMVWQILRAWFVKPKKE